MNETQNTEQTHNRYDLESAAQWLGVSKVTLRRLIKARAITYSRIGVGRGKYSFSEQFLQDYLSKQTIEAVE